MSSITVNGSRLGNELSSIMLAGDIQPGDDVSYQLCKTIYLYHPLGAKMAEEPISMAQSQDRLISIPDSPEEMVREQFLRTQEDLRVDEHAHNVHKTARIYGVASVALLSDKVTADKPIDYRNLSRMEIEFNVFDPLNTAGSLVLNQDPNALDFLKNIRGIAVSGQPYHKSRAVVVMNERPIYIGYTNSAFGYVGRSCYQRALYPMKSYVQTMITDDMVSRKAGVLVAKLKAVGAIITEAMRAMTGLKRESIKLSATNNVISVTAPDEDIQSLNLQNLEGPAAMARKNIIENIATACPMPAKLLLQESFAEGFGEGTEDAKHVAKFIARQRKEMAPTYKFFDQITMFRAWTPEFYLTVQAKFPDYENVPYNRAFYQWANSFKAQWPNLLEEPESEKIKVEETKFKTIIEMLEVLLAKLDPENAAILVQWACDNLNENKLLFSNPLLLDLDALMAHIEEQKARGEEMADAAAAGGGDEDEPPLPKADSIIAPPRRKLIAA